MKKPIKRPSDKTEHDAGKALPKKTTPKKEKEFAGAIVSIGKRKTPKK